MQSAANTIKKENINFTDTKNEWHKLYIDCFNNGAAASLKLNDHCSTLSRAAVVL